MKNIIKVKITKVQELPNALHKYNIVEGYETTRTMNAEDFENPTIGKRFYVGSFSTSLVQEILDSNHFRTFNSIYSWEIID